mmetsp:Transcript_8410/g.33218  ORF Transcript_8410/g.33218 Transcript_8410/m.33218 type:complete len:597 (-) Transcript_8410:422-2212(-)
MLRSSGQTWRSSRRPCCLTLCPWRPLGTHPERAPRIRRWSGLRSSSRLRCTCVLPWTSQWRRTASGSWPASSSRCWLRTRASVPTLASSWQWPLRCRGGWTRLAGQQQRWRPRARLASLASACLSKTASPSAGRRPSHGWTACALRRLRRRLTSSPPAGPRTGPSSSMLWSMSTERLTRSMLLSRRAAAGGTARPSRGAWAALSAAWLRPVRRGKARRTCPSVPAPSFGTLLGLVKATRCCGGRWTQPAAGSSSMRRPAAASAKPPRTSPRRNWPQRASCTDECSPALPGSRTCDHRSRFGCGAGSSTWTLTHTRRAKRACRQLCFRRSWTRRLEFRALLRPGASSLPCVSKGQCPRLRSWPQCGRPAPWRATSARPGRPTSLPSEPAGRRHPAGCNEAGAPAQPRRLWTKRSRLPVGLASRCHRGERCCTLCPGTSLASFATRPTLLRGGLALRVCDSLRPGTRLASSTLVRASLKLPRSLATPAGAAFPLQVPTQAEGGRDLVLTLTHPGGSWILNENGCWQATSTMPPPRTSPTRCAGGGLCSGRRRPAACAAWLLRPLRLWLCQPSPGLTAPPMPRPVRQRLLASQRALRRR